MVTGELQRIPMSYEEWEALPEKPKAEWVDGVAIVSPYATFGHMDASFLLTRLLRESLTDAVAGQELTVRVADRRIRVPDVAAFAKRPEQSVIEQTPLLVVEILSPSTRSEDLLHKAPEYLAAGIGQYWVVDPDVRRIEVHRNDDTAWAELAVVTEESPTATVDVGEHGTVEVVLREILPG